VFAPATPNYYGAQLDAKLNIRRSIGLLLDVAGQSAPSTIPGAFGYETRMQLSAKQFLFGPEFTLRTRRFNPFVHTLFGLTHTSLNDKVGYDLGFIYGVAYESPVYAALAHRTNLALSAGAGLDRNWKKHFAFRLLQADYISTRLAGRWENHFRVSTGMLVKF